MKEEFFKRKDFHTARDCWTKGWDFELQMMIRYVLIIATGVGGSYLILGKAQFFQEWALNTEQRICEFVFLVGFLIAWPTILILERRQICYYFQKQKDDYKRRYKRLQRK